MAQGKKPIARLLRTGFVQDQGKWPAETQERILREAGVKKIIFHDPKLGVALETALDNLRGKEVLELAGGLRALGAGRYSITAAVATVREKGKVVKDCQTKKRSDRDGFDMLSEALAAIHGELIAPNPEDAREWGLNGAKKRWAECRRTRRCRSGPIKNSASSSRSGACLAGRRELLTMFSAPAEKKPVLPRIGDRNANVRNRREPDNDRSQTLADIPQGRRRVAARGMVPLRLPSSLRARSAGSRALRHFIGRPRWECSKRLPIVSGLCGV